MIYILFFSIFIIALFRFVMIFHFKKKLSSLKTIRTLIILGSGGHTSEILDFISTLNLDIYKPRCYVVANTDVGINGSENKATIFEKSKSNQHFIIKKIYRSREVGQSYFTSIFTTLRAILEALKLVWEEKPDLIITNGPGTCVPICFIAFLYKFLGIKWCSICFIESFACVNHLSLTGKILYPISDLFFVQWMELCSSFKKAKYVGRIPSVTNSNDEKDLLSFPVKISHLSYVLVTVGSTLFDPLIQSIDNPEFLKGLKEIGYSGIHIQYGNGKYQPSTQIENFECVYYRYKDSLQDEIKEASLVIGHAGAGTIRDTLSLQKVLIVVPNEALMNNHQIQLAKALSESRYLFYLSISNLNIQNVKQLLSSSQTKPLKTFPSVESLKFSNFLKTQ